MRAVAGSAFWGSEKLFFQERLQRPWEQDQPSSQVWRECRERKWWLWVSMSHLVPMRMKIEVCAFLSLSLSLFFFFWVSIVWTSLGMEGNNWLYDRCFLSFKLTFQAGCCLSEHLSSEFHSGFLGRWKPLPGEYISVNFMFISAVCLRDLALWKLWGLGADKVLDSDYEADFSKVSPSAPTPTSYCLWAWSSGELSEWLIVRMLLV